MENYELVEDIGSGNFGVARLMRNKQTKELVTMKYKKRNCSKDSYKEGKGLLGFFIFVVIGSCKSFLFFC